MIRYLIVVLCLSLGCLAGSAHAGNPPASSGFRGSQGSFRASGFSRSDSSYGNYGYSGYGSYGTSYYQPSIVAFVGPFAPSYGTAVVVAPPVPQVIVPSYPVPAPVVTVPAPALTVPAPQVIVPSYTAPLPQVVAPQVILTPATLPVVPLATLSYLSTCAPPVQAAFFDRTYGSAIGGRLYNHHFGTRGVGHRR